MTIEASQSHISFTGIGTPTTVQVVSSLVSEGASLKWGFHVFQYKRDQILFCRIQWHDA